MYRIGRDCLTKIPTPLTNTQQGGILQDRHFWRNKRLVPHMGPQPMGICTRSMSP